MLIENDKDLKRLYGICLIQFLLVFFIVLVFFRPIDKLDLLWVGSSAILGIYVSGALRRKYMSHFGPRGKEDMYKELAETLTDIRGEENENQK